jgi:hypothetical protein
MIIGLVIAVALSACTPAALSRRHLSYTDSDAHSD